MSAAYAGRRCCRRHLRLDQAGRETEEPVDLPHPLGVALGQVVVDGNDVHAFAPEGIQVDGERRGERLSLTGPHLGDPALVESSPAHELDVEVTLADRPVGRLPVAANASEGGRRGGSPLSSRCRNSTVLPRSSSSRERPVLVLERVDPGTNASRALIFLPSPAVRTFLKMLMANHYARPRATSLSHAERWPRPDAEQNGLPRPDAETARELDELLDVEELLADGVDDGLHAGVQVELLEDVPDVVLDRVLGDEELGCRCPGC